MDLPQIAMAALHVDDTTQRSVALELIEVQSGCYLGEDDMVRFEAVKSACQMSEAVRIRSQKR